MKTIATIVTSAQLEYLDPLPKIKYPMALPFCQFLLKSGVDLFSLPLLSSAHTKVYQSYYFCVRKKNPTAFLCNNCSATKFYWSPSMFPLEDVMHKSIATEHIKLQMKFIVKSRMSSRLVSVFISFINQNCRYNIFIVSKFMCVNCHPTVLTDIRQILKRQFKFTLPNINCSTKAL